jgi:hypothetical protein
MKMENLTNINSDTDNRIIYEDEVCVITEHANYIKVLFIKELIFNTDHDFKDKIKEFIEKTKFENFLIYDFINVRFCSEWDLWVSYDNEKHIFCNLKLSLRQEIKMNRLDTFISVYSTFEDAIEYINTRS